MKIKKIITIKTYETQFYFHPSAIEKNFFKTLQKKIKALYHRANNRHAYAFIMLIEIKSMFDQCVNELLSYYLTSKQLFKKEDINYSDLLIPTIEKIAITITNPLDVKLINCIEQFQKNIILLLIAKQYDLFSQYNEFYTKRNQLRTIISTLFLKLRSICVDDLPKITLQQILLSNASYEPSCQQLGNINLLSLYNALHSGIIPALPPAEFNQIVQRLTQTIQKQIL